MYTGNVADTKSDDFFTSEKIKKPGQKGKGVWFTTEFNYNMLT